MLIDLVTTMLYLVVGFLGGIYWYRYTLKNDPAKLERIMAEVAYRKEDILKGLEERILEEVKKKLKFDQL